MGRPDRIGLGLVVSGLGGVILALMLGSIVPVSTLSTIMTIAGFLGGTALGMVTNWEASVRRVPKRHVRFELDDEEEFDREIEEAMGESSKRY
jgi:hypothetical protein